MIIGSIPSIFTDVSVKEGIVVIYTPAIPPDSRIMSFFRKTGYSIYKRAQVLGAISSETDTLAVAGTHGKNHFNNDRSYSQAIAC
jgi:UDP-N-acetylmuramate--alanine ligase